MIQALDGFPDKILAFACKGHVTKRDYEDVLIPAVEAALKKSGKVRFYYQIDPDFTGFDAGAMWDDFKVGVEHLLRWERFAVVADVDWIRHTVRAFSFLIPGAVRVYRLDETPQAREWIGQGVVG